MLTEKPGILLLHKPLGIRSSACVSLVKHLGGGRMKIGHAGTLDSTAQGLLVLLIGKATRLSRYIMNFPKIYEVTMQFGVSTSTDDASGEILEKKPLPSPENLEVMVDHLIPSFLGTRMQRPPNISAVHVEGKRAHAVARSGEIPKIEEKPVSLYGFRRISPADSQGRISFEVLCSKGTYIRSLARDMGSRLGLGGHSASLCRQALGKWTLEEAVSFESLEEREKFGKEANLEWLASVCRSPLEAARHYSVFTCFSEEKALGLRNGISLPFEELSRESWGILSFRDSLVVRLSEDLVFGDLEAASDKKAFFVPRARIALGETFP